MIDFGTMLHVKGLVTQPPPPTGSIATHEEPSSQGLRGKHNNGLKFKVSSYILKSGTKSHILSLHAKGFQLTPATALGFAPSLTFTFIPPNFHINFLRNPEGLFPRHPMRPSLCSPTQHHPCSCPAVIICNCFR